MALPIDITLLSPNIVISGNASLSGILSNVIQFGLVEQVYTECTKVSEGQYISFLLKDAEPFTINDTQFFLIPDKSLKFIETPAV